ncbi:MAG: ComEC/Rec2 family competence protein [Acidobacteria bacterium]|nr:ComEC/Rec2 family competence protein [Acidobacteriota bacterium]
MTGATVRLLASGAAAWAASVAGSFAPGSASPLALAAGLAAAAACRARARVPWALAALALAFAALGAARARAAAQSVDVVRGRLAEIGAARDGSVLRIASARGARAVFTPRTGVGWLDSYAPGVEPGALVRAAVAPTASGGLCVASASSIELERPAGVVRRALAAPARLRARFASRAQHRLWRGPEDQPGALLLAMVAGSDDGLDERSWRELRASGLAHQAVVSGLQVGLMVLVAAWAAAPLGGAHHPWRRWGALGAAAAALVLLPADPPVRRAGLAVLAARAGRLAGRDAAPPAALGLAVGLVLAADPAVAVSRSFALTVAASAAIVVAAQRGRRAAPWVFLGPWLATWPLLVAMTGRASPWSPLANLAGLPAALPALVAGWIAVLAPSVEHGPGAWALAAGRFAAGWFLVVAREIALWPGSGQVAAPAGALWGAALLALLARVLAAPRRAATVVALAALWAWPLRPAGPPWCAVPRVDVVDVGQGQAVLLRAAGSAVLLDAADDRARDGTRALVHYLRQRRIARLDALVLTQADRDHAGGALELLAAAPPRRLFVPEPLLDVPELHGLLAEAAQRGIPVAGLSGGDRVRAGPLTLAVLHPAPGELRADNERSLVVHVRGWSCAALVAGDAGTATEAELAAAGLDLAADLLVAGHHGSRGSTGAEWLRAVRPAWVALSAGRDNRFGHPHRETLARLRAARIARLTTARSGTIVVAWTARGPRVATGQSVWKIG